MDWKSFVGWILPFAAGFYQVGVFYALRFLSIQKLKLSKYKEMMNIIEGKDINFDPSKDAFGVDTHHDFKKGIDEIKVKKEML